MKIKAVKVGPLETNCYIISLNGDGLIIDPGFEVDKLAEETGKLNILAIILTHGHYDHITEAFQLKKKLGAPVLIHEKDEALMAFSAGNSRADRLLKDGDTVSELKVIHTPGHSAGSICLYNEKEKVLFSGDTLFAGDYGRVDLPGSSPEKMQSSLKKLLALPRETKVYPGHGKPTTIGAEQNLLE